MRIFSGIRASGAKTLGNYSGGFRQYAATQEEAYLEKLHVVVTRDFDTPPRKKMNGTSTTTFGGSLSRTSGE